MTDEPGLIMNEQKSNALLARGAWTVAHVERLEHLCAVSPKRQGPIDLSGVTALDTVGAWLFEKLARGGAAGTSESVFVGASASYASLLREVHELNRAGLTEGRQEHPLIDRLKKIAQDLVADSAAFLRMLGAVSIALGRVLRQPRAFRLTSTVYQLGRVGWQAIPIMALITFLIGAIIAQQGIFHFRKFGADSSMWWIWLAFWCCAKSGC